LFSLAIERGTHSFYVTHYSASNHVDLHHTVHTQHTRTMPLEYRGADPTYFPVYFV
jgi:hypothetical protein